MDLDPHMETDLIITKKQSTPQVPAKSELLQNDALVRARAPFSLFHLFLKCPPKVLPLPRFWHPLGTLYRPKSHQGPFKKYFKKSMRFLVHSGSQSDPKMTSK